MNNKVVDTLNSIKLMLEKLTNESVNDTKSVKNLINELNERIDHIEYSLDEFENFILKTKSDDFNIESLANSLHCFKSEVENLYYLYYIINLRKSVVKVNDKLLLLNDNIKSIVFNKVNEEVLKAISNLNVSIK